MAKRRKGAREARRAERPRPRRDDTTRPRVAAGAALAATAHLSEPGGPVWKHLWSVLALAFAARAFVALSGDFALHPDEIMQYLEQAHRLVFGAGIVHWEHFYGARSWLVPGLIAGVLALFDAVGLDRPVWYVGGVKLVFCAPFPWRFRPVCTSSLAATSTKARPGWRSWPGPSGTSWSASPTSR